MVGPAWSGTLVHKVLVRFLLEHNISFFSIYISTYRDVIFIFSESFFPLLVYFIFTMTVQTPKLLKLKHLTPPTIQSTRFRPENMEAWFCYSEADFHENGMTSPGAQSLTAVKTLPHDFDRYVTLIMFTSDVSGSYETSKEAFLKLEDLIGRPRSGQMFYNIEMRHGSAADMSSRMREVIWLTDPGRCPVQTALVI